MIYGAYRYSCPISGEMSTLCLAGAKISAIKWGGDGSLPVFRGTSRLSARCWQCPLILRILMTETAHAQCVDTGSNLPAARARPPPKRTPAEKGSSCRFHRLIVDLERVIRRFCVSYPREECDSGGLPGGCPPRYRFSSLPRPPSTLP